ncbi:MAG: shikimate dehydrogenase [Mariprofundaceae bacterium]
MEITGKTNIYGIIGCPVEHSLSPVFQAYFAEKYKLDTVYVAYPVEASALQDALKGLPALGIKGVNVTVPYKESVLPFVQPDDDVKRIGAANTLSWRDGVCHASNTDWQGVAAVLQGTGLDLPATSLLLFGSGGTAKAVIHAAYKLGVAKIAVCNRSPDRLKAFIEHAHQHYPTLNVYAVDWSQAAVASNCAESSILINTTSIGLKGDSEFPFQLSGSGWAMDAVYKPSGQTAFTRAAAKAGRNAVDGLPMLVVQGAKSLMLWRPSLQLDYHDALGWMEQHLQRDAVHFPGWRECL